MHPKHTRLPSPRIVPTLALALGLLPAACGDDDEAPSEMTAGSTGTGGEASDTSGTMHGSTSSDPATSSSSEGSSSGALDSTGTEPPQAFEGLEACLQQMVDGPELSAAAAAVVLGDELVWSRGFGVRHPDQGGVVDPDTRFRVGSVTKSMTAVAALSLVDDGSLDLDAPLGELLPPFGDPMHPDWTAALTTRLLMSHQGGLFDYLALDGPREDAALAEAVLGELFAQVPYMVEPGVMWNYSNPNFMVAGLVVEQATAVPYRELVDQRVFAPLGMTRSTFDVQEVEDDGNYAWGVSQIPIVPPIVGATDYDNAWARPAGYAWASATDLGHYARFLLRGDQAALSTAAHQELLTPDVDTQAFLDRVHYGHGLFHADFIPLAEGFIEVGVVEHGGNIPGYTALLDVVPEHDLAIALVGNGDYLDFYPCVAAALDDLPELELEPVVPDTQADLTVLSDYVGDYAEPINVGDFSISQVVTGLRVSFPELDALGIPYEPALIPVSLDNFVVEIQETPVQLTGIRGEDGSLQYLRTRHFVGQRITEEVPPVPRRPDRAHVLELVERLRWDRPVPSTLRWVPARGR